MSRQNPESDILIKKTLENFFSKKEISEFKRKKLFKIPKSKSSVRKSPDIANHFQFYSQIDLLITFAGSKLAKDKYLKLLGELSFASVNSGEFSTAIYINETILHVVKRDKKYSSVRANALLNIGEIYSRQALQQESSSYIRLAVNIFKNLHDKDGMAKCENLLGTIHGECLDELKSLPGLGKGTFRKKSFSY